MAFMIFGLFWMCQDHASLWWIIPFVVFQAIESVPTDTSGEQTRYVLYQILQAVKGGRNVR